ncbi:MAG: hypothetical protein WA702_11640 [Bradyrhizobium sp.]|jgi:hypothetical protein
MSFEREQNSGDAVALQDNPYSVRQGFSTEDILWATGIWTTIVTLTPMILFYLLMVA